MIAALLPLISRLTKARADKLDNLDAAISGRSTNAGVWSHPTRTLTESVSANVIKSIQRGYLNAYDANANFLSSESAYYLTISPVDVAKTMIIWNPHTYANSSAGGYALLVSSSQLKLSWTAPSDPGAVCNGSWQVIEFY